MYHKQRWTPEKIKFRLELITPLVYIKRKPLPSFRYRELETALTPPQIGGMWVEAATISAALSRWQDNSCWDACSSTSSG